MLFPDIPIDIDVTHKLCSLPAKGYYYCRDSNHIIENYPVRLDVQQLTTEQWEKLMEDLNILKDIEIRQHLELDITSNTLTNQDFV